MSSRKHVDVVVSPHPRRQLLGQGFPGDWISEVSMPVESERQETPLEFIERRRQQRDLAVPRSDAITEGVVVRFGQRPSSARPRPKDDPTDSSGAILVRKRPQVWWGLGMRADTGTSRHR